MPTVDFVDRSHAVKYIKQRGYVSYSSLNMYKNGEVPKKVWTQYFQFGTEFHARSLEKKITMKLSKEEEALAKAMLKEFDANKMVKKLLSVGKPEQEFKKVVLGLTVYGRIDWKAPKYNVDLKTTRLKNLKAFVSAMDFLQAVMYQKATGNKDFYYIGASKEEPYPVMVFNVLDYPEKLKAAEKEFKELMGLLKTDLRKCKL